MKYGSLGILVQSNSEINNYKEIVIEAIVEEEDYCHHEDCQ